MIATASESDTQQGMSNFQQLPIAQLIPFARNPRKSRNVEEDKRLAESVAAKGVLQPLLVRPIKGKDDRYEVVFGNRRLDAARSAKLSFVPCQVRPLSDSDALEVALIENVQRHDVHPIEEAEGFKELVSVDNYTIADVAKKTGRLEKWVRARLKLAEVHKSGRDACLNGKLSAAVVMVVARFVPMELQEEAFSDLVREAKYNAMSEDRARRTVMNRFVRRMENAAWRLDDAKLVPEAGACSTCPHRSANDRGLFAEVDKEDICTNGACWLGKMTAHRDRVLAAAEKNGQTVLTGKSAAKAVTDMVHAQDTEWNGKRHVPVSAIANKAKLVPVIAVDDKTGEVRELYKQDDIDKLMGRDVKRNAHHGQGESDDYKAKLQANAKTARIENRTTVLALGIAVDAMAKRGFAVFDAEARKSVFSALIREFWSDLFRLAAQRRGLSGKGTGKHSFLGREELEKWCKDATCGEVEALIFELVIWRARSHNEGGDFNPNVPLKALGADLAKLKKAAIAELAPKAKTAKTKEKKK